MVLPSTEPYAEDVEVGKKGDDTPPKDDPEPTNIQPSTPQKDVSSPFHNPFQTRASETFHLAWQNLTFQVELAAGCPCVGGAGGGVKTIVDNVSGSLKPGSLTAIMGPSGAGKTTLMNVLAGRAPYGTISGGKVFLNKKDADPVLYRSQLAYVMQQDALFATQTPNEVLAFTAAMRLPEYDQEQRAAIVQAAIKALGLKDCCDTLIGSTMVPGLSGGEKKRTAVAVELISSPSLIFLDEPTSGLDSHSAFELVKILRTLADSGCTIVCTIHQPSSEVFALFHDVIILKSGRVAYSGKIESCGSHFETEDRKCPIRSNPADFAMHRLQLMSLEECEPFIAKAEAEIAERNPTYGGEGTLEAADLPTSTTAGFCVQMAYLVRREFFNLVRDRQSLGARYGMSMVLSLLIGVIFFQVGSDWGTDGDPDDITVQINNHWGALVFSCINSMFLSSQPMLLAFPIERAAFMREYTSGSYSTPAYILGKTCIDVPAAFLQMLLATCVFYFLVDMQGNFAYIVFAQVGLGVVSASSSLLMGAATTRPETAIHLVPALYVPQILFSGFFISLDEVPIWLRWLQYLCPLKYGVGLATMAEFADDAVPDNREGSVARLIHRTNLNREDWWILVVIMFALFFAFRIIGAFLLAWRARSFQ